MRNLSFLLFSDFLESFDRLIHFLLGQGGSQY